MLGEGTIKAHGAAAAGQGTALGFLGGLDIPVINDFLVGYVAGAQAIDRRRSRGLLYRIVRRCGEGQGAGAGAVPHRRRDRLQRRGAGRAGPARRGEGERALRHRVDSDQSAIFAKTDPATADRVVTSVLKRVDVSLARAFDLLEAGKLPVGHEESLGLKDGAVGIVDNALYQKLVPADVRAKVTTASADIAAGKIAVPTALGMPTDQIVALRNKVRP